MSDIIHLLPDHVANQIAAGEVVQRPASVIKELLENAIDAKADSITIILKEAGRNLIQVIDNGSGMSITDARMAFERHATSKIKSTEDIFSIHTKGFRGEALASIAAVAQCELKTKNDIDDLGTQILIDGGDLVSQHSIVTPKGSIFTVKNLFYNVPARRKFLKSNTVEFRHILDEFYRVALAHENVSFQLFHNDEEIYKLKSSNKAQRIVDLMGKKMQNFLLPINEQTEWISLSGFIGNIEIAKKSRTEQFFFVNNRYFKSYYLNKAVNDAYEDLIPSQHFPSFFIYLEINPELIDVNIHPTKTEIKFEKESDVYALIRSSVKKALGIYKFSPVLNFDNDPTWESYGMTSEIRLPKIDVDKNFNPFEKYSQPKVSTQEKINITELYAQNFEIESKMDTLFEQEDYNLTLLSNGLWQMEKDEVLYFMDFHRIHQTILYEKMLKNSKGNVLSQQLLLPYEYPIEGAEVHKLRSIKEKLFSIGFDVEIDSEICTVHAIPSDLPDISTGEILQNMLMELDEDYEQEFELFFSKTVAKFAALKKNQLSQKSSVLPLIKDFEKMNFPLYSPFGKNNYTVISLEELNKKMI